MHLETPDHLNSPEQSGSSERSAAETATDSGWLEQATLRLRPGVRVVERDGRVQLGIDPGRRVLLQSTPAVRELLAALDAGVSGTVVASSPSTDALTRAGLIQVVVPPMMARHVEFVGGTPWDSVMMQALLRLGVKVRPTTAPKQGVAVVLGDGEPPRHVADLCALRQIPLLPLALVDGRLRLGPFIEPGVTACLRCLDAYAAFHDPDHERVLAAYTVPRPDEARGLPAWVMDWAASWLAADVIRYCEGKVPTTWSTAVWLSDDAPVEFQPLGRHLHCGCSWPELISQLTG